MKQLEEDMSQEPFLWISNQELWIVLEQDHLDNFLDQIILYLVKLELEIIGQKVIILKVLNL